MNEFDHRRREALRRSLANPHVESIKFTDNEFETWLHGLPEDDCEALVAYSAGRPIRWIYGEGWVYGRE
jgi:hypothetical protein